MAGHRIVKTYVGLESYPKLPSNLNLGIRWLTVISLPLRPPFSCVHWIGGWVVTRADRDQSINLDYIGHS
jgi:hypothetical protein